jgi:hypothetical protein
LAADEDLAFAVAGGDAEVGFAGFAGALDHTAHHGDAEWDGEAVECAGDLLGEGVDVNLGAPAGESSGSAECGRIDAGQRRVSGMCSPVMR